MVSKRNFFSITIMMFVLLFLFQFSMVIRDRQNTYDVNSNFTTRQKDGKNVWKNKQIDPVAVRTTDRSYALFVGDSSSDMATAVSRWCIYAKWDMAQCRNLEDYQENDKALPGMLILESEKYALGDNLEKLKKLEQKGTVSYTSSHPLTLYSTRNDKIYYSAFSGEGKGNQIYLDNNETGEKKTDQFCDFNYLIQCGEQYFMAAELLHHYCIEPIVCDAEFQNCSRVMFDKKDDRFTWMVSTVPKENKIVFSHYSDNEMREADDVEGGNAPSKIAMLDLETKKTETVYETKYYIDGIACEGKKLILSCAPNGFTTRQKHTRECFVVLEEGADAAKVEEEIKTMPNYFSDYDTTVHFISEEELKANHSGIPHGGFVLRSGKTGWNGENKHLIEYSLKLDSNPEFTSSVLIAYARAAYRLASEGQSGCKTVFDIAPAYLSAKSGEELRKHML